MTLRGRDREGWRTEVPVSYSAGQSTGYGCRSRNGNQGRRKEVLALVSLCYK